MSSLQTLLQWTDLVFCGHLGVDRQEVVYSLRLAGESAGSIEWLGYDNLRKEYWKHWVYSDKGLNEKSYETGKFYNK